MGSRSKARKRALDLLYAGELRGEDPVEVLERVVAEGAGPPNAYTAELVRGVSAHREEIDEAIRARARAWTLERMPAVDRNALRIGVFEILHVDDVPGQVAVAEAVELVRDLSTDESPSFVNGVLDAVRRQHG